MYNYDKMKEATKMFLEAIGEDPNREGLIETPDRVARMYGKLLDGYDEDITKHAKLFTATSDDMVTLHNIPFYSFCEHHIILFIGRMHMCYVPDKHVIGVSKLIRIARSFTKRLNIQEELTKNIADAIENLVKPKGVAVQVQAQHFCITLRGARSTNGIMTTTAVRGVLKDNPMARSEFLDTIKRNDSVFSY
jgi:GTP cyclohydrolase I